MANEELEEPKYDFIVAQTWLNFDVASPQHMNY